MIKTKNFNPKTDVKLKCTCGHAECDQRSIDQDSLNKMQLIRDDISTPLKITSGGRCSNHRNELNKSRAGDHQLCKALDVACNSEDMETKLKVLAGRHGATRVAGTWEDGFIHIAWTVTTRTDVPTWRYK